MEVGGEAVAVVEAGPARPPSEGAGVGDIKYRRGYSASLPSLKGEGASCAGQGSRGSKGRAAVSYGGGAPPVRAARHPRGGVLLALIGEGVAAADMDERRMRAWRERERKRRVGVGGIGSHVCWPNRSR
jgi:hypothetical protein